MCEKIVSQKLSMLSNTVEEIFCCCFFGKLTVENVIPLSIVSVSKTDK